MGVNFCVRNLLIYFSTPHSGSWLRQGLRGVRGHRRLPEGAARPHRQEVLQPRRRHQLLRAGQVPQEGVLEWWWSLGGQHDLGGHQNLFLFAGFQFQMMKEYGVVTFF